LALWRESNPKTFEATIGAAGERLKIQPLAVEKDYWACEVLRAIVQSHPGEVVFKGGTSLEKLRIIQRLSEDVDILVIGTTPRKGPPVEP
jgi:predicted nucleotidyltransferase component of viral defense system